MKEAFKSTPKMAHLLHAEDRLWANQALLCFVWLAIEAIKPIYQDKLTQNRKADPRIKIVITLQLSKNTSPNARCVKQLITFELSFELHTIVWSLWAWEAATDSDEAHTRLELHWEKPHLVIVCLSLQQQMQMRGFGCTPGINQLQQQLFHSCLQARQNAGVE